VKNEDPYAFPDGQAPGLRSRTGVSGYQSAPPAHEKRSAVKRGVEKGDHTAFNYNQGIKKDLISCGGNVAIYDGAPGTWTWSAT